MHLHKLNPETLTSTFSNLIAQVVVASPSKLGFISGQVAVDSDGNLV
ncbi:hypothetical protein SAMN04487969_1036 [Paenibacillus algorifonticola]|uniref:Uncharacterized protein n=1 Tax=Paenibacillus algorifonticola TaxID=684063 RepID=A0A1I2AXN0_9BACL|nr:hypothetical protein [Paenibacillus algorifonticola]SFE48398.1 hypothetical protein SAMN04487969_1036 [Paenibacillus algorifonticola]